MSEYLWLTGIGSALDKWGVTWEPYIEDWQTHAGYGPAERSYTPVGILNHHTASTNWYPKEKLTTKCNIYIDPDGTAWVMSAGYQFDSGDGDPNVLYRTRNDHPIEPPEDTSESDRILGNQWFIDIEVGHWGHGEPIPKAQRDTLIATNAALLDMMGWSPKTRLLGHKEWTRRKVDPRWSWLDEADSMDAIRKDTEDKMSEASEPKFDLPLRQFRPSWEKGVAKKIVSWEHSDPWKPVTKQELVEFFDRLSLLD